jgi:hypothetical protein
LQGRRETKQIWTLFLPSTQTLLLPANGRRCDEKKCCLFPLASCPEKHVFASQCKHCSHHLFEVLHSQNALLEIALYPPRWVQIAMPSSRWKRSTADINGDTGSSAVASIWLVRWFLPRANKTPEAYIHNGMLMPSITPSRIGGGWR